MYTKGQLERFADQIPDAEAQQCFRDRIADIAFENEEGLTVCMGGVVADVLEGSGVEYLARELASRILEFVTEEELKVGIVE